MLAWVFILFMQSCSHLTKPTVSFPKPSGDFQIGFKKYFFKNPNRQDPFIEEKSPREITVNLYYPADGINASEVPYINKKLLKYFQSEFKNNGLDQNVLSLLRTGIYEETKISKRKDQYPLIILSHGSGGTPEFYTILIKELVSHGFIVAAINHTYNSYAALLSDNSIKFNSDVFNQFLQRLQLQGLDFYGVVTKTSVDDIQQTIDGLKNSDLNKFINFKKIGMVGHSIGGMAVSYACPNFSECTCGVNLDGPLLGGPKSPLRTGNLSGNLLKPFLFLIGNYITNVVPNQNDPKYKNKTILEAIYKLNAPMSLEEYYQFNFDRYYNRLVRAVNKMGKNTTVVTFDHADHMAFSDYRLLNSYLLKTDKEKDDERRTIMQMNTILLNFFSKHLQNKKNNLLKNLKGKDAKRGIKVHTFSNPLKIKNITIE